MLRGLKGGGFVTYKYLETVSKTPADVNGLTEEDVMKFRRDGTVKQGNIDYYTAKEYEHYNQVNASISKKTKPELQTMEKDLMTRYKTTRGTKDGMHDLELLKAVKARLKSV